MSHAGMIIGIPGLEVMRVKSKRCIDVWLVGVYWIVLERYYNQLSNGNGGPSVTRTRDLPILATRAFTLTRTISSPTALSVGALDATGVLHSKFVLLHLVSAPSCHA